MIDPKQLLNYIIRPVLHDLSLWSQPAERLVLGTACQESQCGRYLHQLGDGPALGIYQIEPATHDDIWKNYLDYLLPANGLPALMRSWAIKRRVMGGEPYPDAEEMIGNLYYATAMCRIQYYRVPSALPTYLAAQAAYWKKNFNTELGAGTVEEYMNNWNRFVTPDVML